MDQDQLFIEIYKTYTDCKEKFITRSFATNKFYLVTTLVMLLIVVLSATTMKNDIVCIVFSLLGMLVSAMWWFNQDSYQYLTKIKYGSVIEEMEKRFPFAPSTVEFQAIKEQRKNKRIFVFTNAQKLLSFVVIVTFLAFFMLSVGPYLVAIFNTEYI